MAAKLQVKLYAEDTTLDGEAYIPLFHGWIRDSAMPELLIDVADYRHVPDGPGVALIGHESDYFLDFQDGRPGLLCALKHADAEGLAAQLRLALTRAALGGSSPFKASSRITTSGLETRAAANAVFRRMPWLYSRMSRSASSPSPVSARASSRSPCPRKATTSSRNSLAVR